MRFWGFGKKQPPEPVHVPLPPHREVPPSAAPGVRTIAVYSTSDGARCRQVRGLLEKRGYDYQDIRIDEDLSMRSWLQRTTGDAALPKIFVGSTCYGGFEDIQTLVFDGTFDRILRGEADQEGTVDPLAALKEDMTAVSIQALLRKGEILIIKEGDMEMEAWAEPLANPPLVYYEGAPRPLDELETIAQEIVLRLEAGGIEVSWKEDD